MEFIPESAEALRHLDPTSTGLRSTLQRMADSAREIAPELAGISITTRIGGLTFTLVATNDEVAALDAIQYLDTGPCVDALEHGEVNATTVGGLLDEERWQALAQAAAAVGIHSTLTLPVRVRGETTGTVNLYGRTEDTFTGKHDAIARVVGGWARGAVTNADLSFTTRQAAQRAPEQIQTESAVATAAGMLSVRLGLTLDQAYGKLQELAARAGVSVDDVAEAILRIHDEDT